MDTSSKRVVVIGAGPAGLSCAVQLAEAGLEVRVLESSDQVGGLARSFSLWGRTVDLGPHRFFSPDDVVNQFWLSFVGSDFIKVRRLTRIYFNKQFIFYPLKLGNVLTQIGPRQSVRALSSYAVRRFLPSEAAKTFENWMVNRFGRRLYEMFFRDYSEKVWGIPPDRLDANWAAQRIKSLSLFEAVKDALGFNRSAHHPTLVDQFVYPRGGTGMVYQRMADRLREFGGHLELRSEVRRIRFAENGSIKGVELSDGHFIEAHTVVSTMPLNMMVKGLERVPAVVTQACNRLTYRNTILVYLELNQHSLFEDQWLYIHDPGIRTGRITNFNNWVVDSGTPPKNTVLCLEYWCFDSDGIWTAPDGEIAALAALELSQIKLIPSGVSVLNSFVLRVPKSYPVYEIGYDKHLEVIQNYLDGIPDLITIGRYGSFRYNNQDHSILMGLLAARQIIEKKPQNLRTINTSSDYQEESPLSGEFSSGRGPHQNRSS